MIVLKRCACLVTKPKGQKVENMAAFSKYLLISVPVVALAGIAALWWQREKRERSYTEVGRVSSLIIYPVKSCKGIRVDNAKCFKEGMEHDR